MALPSQIGKYNKHVNESYGPDNNIMKFYVTEYSSKLGIDGFKPKHGQHIGTGYKSNLRPQIYYTRKLDELDNPNMGKIVSNNYHSITDKHYRPYMGATGTEPLPINTFIQPNSYIKENHRTTPTQQEAYSIYNPTRLRQKPFQLASLKNNDPIPKENNNNGPAMFSTEHHTQFQSKNPHVESTHKSIGVKEDSGFTLSKNLEPITFQPENAHDGQYPGWYTNRPTGNSMMKTDYLPHHHSKGNEELQDIAHNAERDNGFTRYILPTAQHTAGKNQIYTTISDIKHPDMLEKKKRSDPTEYANMAYPNRFPSLYKTTYQGNQLHAPNLADQLNRQNIGDKEDSGFVENNKSYTLGPRGDFDGTHYGNEYVDKNHPMESHLNRLNNANLHPLQEDGYTKSEKLHTNGKNSDSTAKQLQYLHPYVNRSLKARDPFYAEKIYEHKKREMIVG